MMAFSSGASTADDTLLEQAEKCLIDWGDVEGSKFPTNQFYFFWEWIHVYHSLPARKDGSIYPIRSHTARQVTWEFR